MKMRLRKTVCKKFQLFYWYMFCLVYYIYTNTNKEGSFCLLNGTNSYSYDWQAQQTPFRSYLKDMLALVSVWKIKLLFYLLLYLFFGYAVIFYEYCCLIFFPENSFLFGYSFKLNCLLVLVSLELISRLAVNPNHFLNLSLDLEPKYRARKGCWEGLLFLSHLQKKMHKLIWLQTSQTLITLNIHCILYHLLSSKIFVVWNLGTVRRVWLYYYFAFTSM